MNAPVVWWGKRVNHRQTVLLVSPWYSLGMAHTPGECGVWKVFPDKESGDSENRKEGVGGQSDVSVGEIVREGDGKELEPVREPAWLKRQKVTGAWDSASQRG